MEDIMEIINSSSLASTSTSSPEQLVYEALHCACSQDINLLKQAENQLAEWETAPGFYLTLLSTFLNQQVDINVRWMAAVYFKNGINKYWRKNATNELQESEKSQIRKYLLSNFNEPVPQIAVQIATSISKISRMDYPKEWPELIPILMEQIKEINAIQQNRALLVLLHVIKALSSKRLYYDKKLLEEVSRNIYSCILNYWDGYTTLYFQSLQQNNTQELESIIYLEKATLLLRILRKLIIYGFSRPDLNDNCMLFLNAIFRRLKESLECRYELKRRQSSTELIEMTEKFILKQSKILNEFLEHHPVSFESLITTALEFSFNYVFHNGATLIFENNVINFENFAIHCINLMKGILLSVAYKAPIKNQKVNLNEVTGYTDKKNFFTKERLSYICEKIITHYFLLTQNDLESWIDDPENFSSEEGGENWKYALRPCTESFFLTLFEFKEDMVAEVFKYVNNAQEMKLTPESDLKDILLKDAIYTGIGLCDFNYHCYYDKIDFDSWLTHQLLDEIKIKSDNFPIIRRKVIWLIGKWSNVKLSKNLRPKVYETCLELLGTQEDMAVRITASKTLMSTIDNFDFETQLFLPYVEPCFSALFILLKEAKKSDTKLNILCSMSIIVKKMSDDIRPQVHNLISFLPLLWKESEDHNMLRCAIISTLVDIIKSFSDVPSEFQDFLYPVIEFSTNVKIPSYIYLIEEGLELWLAIVQNSKTLTPQLLDLCKNLIPIIEMSSENLRTVLFIIRAYIILSPDIYLRRYGKNIISTCAYLITDMRHEGITFILQLFETCLMVDPNYGIELMKDVLPYIFKQIYEYTEPSMVITLCLVVIARVLIINQEIFIKSLQETNLTNALETILDNWISQMPIVKDIEEKKLLSLALGSILTVDNSILYERFPGILKSLYQTLKKIDDYVVYDDDCNSSKYTFDSDEFEYDSYHYERTRKLCLKDPVHSIELKNYIQSQLSTLKRNLGDERYQSLMLTVDNYFLKDLSQFVDIFIEIPEIPCITNE